jgi:hypothetical protein
MCGASASAASERGIKPRIPWYRLPLLMGSGLALIAGICTGLARLGWAAPLSSLAEFHGPILMSGLFGAMTGLERAVASRRSADYVAPALCCAGTVLILCGAVTVGATTYLLAAMAASASTLYGLIRRPALFSVSLAAAALFWLMGNLVWLSGSSVPEAAGWWLAFLIFVIGGERLEFGGPKPGGILFTINFWLSLGAIALGSARTLIAPGGGAMFGIGLLLCAVWLIRNDFKACTARSGGQNRFLAACLIASYVWILVAGTIGIAGNVRGYAFAYDMLVHAVVLGFALSMVFGHALLVFPAILRIRLAYSPLLYLALALLQSAVALRIGSDLAEWIEGRMWSGSLTAFALAAFAATLAVSTRKARERTASAENAVQTAGACVTPVVPR